MVFMYVCMYVHTHIMSKTAEVKREFVKYVEASG